MGECERRPHRSDASVQLAGNRMGAYISLAMVAVRALVQRAMITDHVVPPGSVRAPVSSSGASFEMSAIEILPVMPSIVIL